MQKGSYQFETLASKEMEITHLLERAQLRLDGFIDLLIRHQFPTQGKILEVGCAHGLRTHLMATHFTQTQVIGIDRSQELLQIAHEKYQEVTNLSFQLADLYQLPFSDHTFDFIYIRLVFMHLSNPLSALNEFKRVLKPGGRILIEDADRDCMFFEPQPASFKDFWLKVQEGQRRLGGDPNVGRKLATYLKTTCFQQIQIEVQPIVGANDEIAFLLRTLLSSLKNYLKPNEQLEGEKALNDLEQLSLNNCASFYHFWFVVSGAKSLIEAS